MRNLQLQKYSTVLVFFSKTKKKSNYYGKVNAELQSCSATFHSCFFSLYTLESMKRCRYSPIFARICNIRLSGDTCGR